MNTQEIAARLVALSKKGEFEAAQKELFSRDAVSIEPKDTPQFPKETKGIDGIFEKGRKFGSMIETIHSISVSEPVVAGDAFACALQMDVTMRGRGRTTLSEICVYDVENGKIISEQFHM